jgi:predicted flavoprotein YhiN
MAALSAATAGCEVVLFEAMPSPGRKLLVTGGGRCNLTTTASTVDIMQAFGRHGRFAAPALDFYGTAEIRNFFAAAGVPTVSEADGSVFPESQRAGDILRVLQELAELCANAPLTVTATEGWARAIITRGGIDRRELDPQSLAVRRVSGLFCAGECVDIDGPCGGYNLTWAFASGALAGHAAAAYLAKEAASAKP